jgi:hypothetical protein
VTNWINNLNSATQVPGEISSAGVGLTIGLVESITSTVNENGFDPTTSLNGLLNALDSASTAVTIANNTNIARRRRFLTTSEGDSFTDEALSLAMGIDASVKSYADAIASSLLPGQREHVEIKNNLRTFIPAYSLVDGSSSSLAARASVSASASAAGTSSTCDKYLTVTLPQTSLEKALGVQKNILRIPTCQSSSSSSSSSNDATSMQLAFSSLSNDLYNQMFDSSNNLQLHLTNLPCPDCSFEITMRRDPTATNMSEYVSIPSTVINVTCNLGDYQMHKFDCPNGKTYNVSCRGQHEIISSKCPSRNYEPHCNLLGDNSLDPIAKSCSLVRYTAQNVTCLCSSSARRRLAAQNSSSSTSSGEIDVNYVSMMAAVGSNFESTVLSAEDLNASVITKGWIAMVTIGGLFGFFVTALSLAYYADYRSSRVEPTAKVEKKASSIFNSTRNSKVDLGLKQQQQRRASTVATSSIIQLAEESLPQILSSKSLMSRVMNELKRHHRWFGIIYYYSPQFPRVLRVMSLATNIVIMLFVQSLTYDLTNGNDGSCERLETESDCLGPRSAYATGQPKCYWTPDTPGSTTDGLCQYIQPESSMEVVIFVAIFSALISAPFALFADRLIINVLAAPTALATTEGQESSKIHVITDANNNNSNKNDSFANGLSIIPRDSTSKLSAKIEGIDDLAIRDELKLIIKKKFEQLTFEIQQYRQFLADQSQLEREEFDFLWGLDEHGQYRKLTESPLTAKSNRSVFSPIFRLFRFLKSIPMIIISFIKRIISAMIPKPKPSETASNEDEDDQVIDINNMDNIGDIILSELESLEKQLAKEKALYFAPSRQSLLLRGMTPLTEREKSKRLLYLFQKDLLPGINGLILESKEKRDEEIIKGKSKTMKAISLLYLIMTNVGMLFYILLFALSQDSYRQKAWGQSFALWVIICPQQWIKRFLIRY